MFKAWASKRFKDNQTAHNTIANFCSVGAVLCLAFFLIMLVVGQ